MTGQRLDRVLVCFRIGDPEGRFPIYSAEGSRLALGRWHAPEFPVIYASEHYSTAMLEKLARGGGSIPPNQHYIEITIPNGISFEMVTSDTLSAWSEPDGAAAREFGSSWARELRSALLLVPSYVARIERNIIINPRHPETDAIRHSLPAPVWWDERLFDRG